MCQASDSCITGRQPAKTQNQSQLTSTECELIFSGKLCSNPAGESCYHPLSQVGVPRGRGGKRCAQGHTAGGHPMFRPRSASFPLLLRIIEGSVIKGHWFASLQIHAQRLYLPEPQFSHLQNGDHIDAITGVGYEEAGSCESPPHSQAQGCTQTELSV